MELGVKIRSLRKSMDMSIEQLSKFSGLSTGMISQMERDKTVPSVETLLSVATALNVHINYFFDEYKTSNPIIRRNERKKIILPQSNTTYELLCPDINRKMELLLITIEPGESSHEEQHVHEGEECGYILQGTLHVKWGSKEFVLNQGDSIYYECNVPHLLTNHGDITCTSIWTITPPCIK
jgi:transcriptional regulator with XRE-family HTH domain